MKLLVKGGTTSKLLQVFIQDASKADGSGLTGLVYNSSGLSAYYYREAAASATAITLATMTVGTWATGGFKEVDATNMPGVYQLGIPDAAIATSANSVVVMLKGASNMAPVVLEVQLVSFDPGDSVRFGLSALPNAAAEAAGGLYTRGTGAGQINQPANGLIDVNTLRWNGTAVATPATAGVPDVNVKNMNNVAATSITTINANQGTTQPINFTGTGASALAKSDMVDVAGAAVSASTAQLGVNVVNWSGSAVATPNTNGVPIVDRREWVRTNTAQAGASGSITLDASASATADFYKGCLVTILSSTGAGQTRLITAYNGSTKVATITPAWATNPTSSSVFAVLPEGIADVEAWIAAAPNALQSGRVDSYLGATGAVTLAANVTQFGGTNGTFASGRPEVNTTHVAGTAQTARDLGASVLISSGTGTGQLDVTSGVIKANLAQILGTALTETSGQIAAAFKKFFNVATPTGTINSIPDAVAGASGGLFIAGSNAATTVNITGNITGNLSGSVGSLTTNNDKTGYSLTTLESAVLHSGTAQAGASTTITLATGASATTDLYVGAVVKVYGGTGAAQSRIVTAYNGSTKVATVDRAWSTNPASDSTYAILATDSAKTNSSLEVVSASVSGAVGSVTGNVGGNVTGSVGSVTAGVTVSTNNDKTGYRLSATGVDDVWDEAQSGHTTAGTFGKYLDAQVSSIPTSSAPSAATIADAVWDETRSDHTTSGSFGQGAASVQGNITGSVASVTASVTVGTNNDKSGYSLSSAGVQAIWDALTSALTTAGSIGKRIADNLDAAVSSRSTYAGADTSGTTTLLSRLTSTRAANLDNLDATISSRSTLTAAQVNAEADTALADVGLTTTTTGRIDAAISTRATPAQVNTEVVDALSVDMYAEPGSVPASTSSLKDKIGWLFTLARNKVTMSSTTQTLKNDAGSGNIATSLHSDDGSVYTREEWS